MRNCLLIGAGGFLGTVLRYLISLAPLSERTHFPFATLLINVLGALAIGVLAGLAGRYGGAHAQALAFLRIGVCGGFTTFSTFALEITDLWGRGRGWTGILYMSLSLILGIGAVLAGKRIAA